MPLSYDIVIPTWKAEPWLPGLLAAIARQTRPPERVVVIDSSSPDRTVELARAAGAEVLVIPKAEFDHGGTRNRAVQACSSEAVVFLTQDALPEDDALGLLVAALDEPGVEAAYARQTPRPDASPPEAYARTRNYPEAPERRTAADIDARGVKAYFFSNVASAVRRGRLLALGGFPDRLPMNEDMVLCARILAAGGAVAYAAGARVRHSHAYTLAQQARRYFDIGAFFALFGDQLPGARVGGEGLRYAAGEASWLLRRGHLGWALRSPLESLAKIVSYQAGRLHRRLPGWLVRRWSMHPFFYDRPAPAPGTCTVGGRAVRVAVVHDWIETCGGSELVLFEILRCLPAADLHALVDFRDARCAEALAGRRIATSFIQRLPFARRLFRWYLPLMPLAIEQLDLRGYDLVVSSSHAVAKGVITAPDQPHLCYCHSPLRYAWDQQNAYLDGDSGARGPFRLLSRPILHYLRVWDATSSCRVDRFLANSAFVARRIAKYYRRSATVMHPPVPVAEFPPGGERGGHYLAVSRLVGYKRVDLLVEAFASMPGRTLLVVGDGPERRRLESKAPANVRFLGALPTPEVRRHFAGARAFCFAAEEDFGIVLVEAMACGTPVIAYGRGGALDVVEPGVTGLLFPRQDAAAVAEAVRAFEASEAGFDRAAIRLRAARFSSERFRRDFLAAAAACLDDPREPAP